MKRGRYMGHSVDEEAFDKLSVAAKYWIGFIMADGYVLERESRQNLLGVGLSNKDAGHLEKLREFLKSSYSARRRGTGGMCLEIASDRIAMRLKDFGVIPKKSLVGEVLLLERDRHFWRGMVDGDGCLTRMKRGEAYYPALHLCGGKRILEQFAYYVNITCGIGGCRVYAVKREHKDFRTCTITGENAVKIIERLYGNPSVDFVSLDRKQAIAEKFMRREFSP